MKKKLVTIVLVAIVNCAAAIPKDAFCCPSGQGILKRKINPHYCWDPISDTNTTISLTCSKAEIVPDRLINFTVNEAGELELISDIAPTIKEPGTFCVGDGIIKKSPNPNTIRVMVVCTDEDEDDIVDPEVLGYCLFISAIFLAFTAVVYIILPEIRDLQGKSIINFCGSLAMGLCLLGVMKIISYSDMKLCAARGFFTYFFLITGFFWMNAISIQMLLNIRRPTVCDYGWQQFKWYALYAWGCPALLTICMAIVNYCPGKHHKPGIGLNHCWFFNHKQQWIYMYSVMSILIAANVCIFAYISVLLWRQTFSAGHVKALKYKFLMTLRLFVVMGLPWIFEMISSSMKSSIVWVVLDLFNALQGPLIFLFLVLLRRRVVKAMHKHGYLYCISGPVEKYLAAAHDDEEDIIQHTIVLAMYEKNNT